VADPNKAFRNRKHMMGHKRPTRIKSTVSVVMIRCEATNCGRKTVVSRDQWLDSDLEIVCSNCGSTHAWEAL
jgi:hypothetical protein